MEYIHIRDVSDNGNPVCGSFWNAGGGMLLFGLI